MGSGLESCYNAVAAALTSPHTIELYDFGVREDGQYYYVMEMLEGIDLQEMVDRHGPLPPARVAHFLRQSAKSLAEAHECGMVHRDIKPSNLFVSRRGLELDFIKVLDFGIVKLGADRPPVQDELKLTMVEAPIGTPAFMPPEGVEGAGHLSADSDIYSLGCTAFWMLTGELRFRAGSLMQMLYKHVNEAPRKPSAVHGTAIPADLDELVLRCLSKSPAARPADGKALLAAIERVADYEKLLVKLSPKLAESEHGRKYVVNQYVENILIEKEAEARGLTKDPALAAKMEDYTRSLYRNSILQTLKEGQKPISDEEAKKYFQEHEEEFIQPDRVRLSLIEVPLETKKKSTPF